MDLHVFENNGGVRLVGNFNKEGQNTYESFSWVLSDNTIDNLNGGNIYLHKSKSTPSFFGGNIVSIRREPTEGNRAVVRFVSNPDSVKPPTHWPRQDWVTN